MRLKGRETEDGKLLVRKVKQQNITNSCLCQWHMLMLAGVKKDVEDFCRQSALFLYFFLTVTVFTVIISLQLSAFVFFDQYFGGKEI